MSIIIERALKGKFVLIAEIGVNYYDVASQLQISPLEAAQKMILEAKNAGIHAVKFQSYKANTLASKYSPSYWDTNEENTTSQYELFKKYDSFDEKHYILLANYCKKIGIEFLSTAFDFNSADFLDPLMNVYKISSSDITNHPFIQYQAKKNKPIILSTGASNYLEIKKAVDIIRKNNNKPIILMHCILEYPTLQSHSNLNNIISLKNKFPDLIIGYSDHTKPDKNLEILKTAYNLGAIIIEKHFTLDKSLVGNDHYHSMDVLDAIKLNKDIKFIDKIRGSNQLISFKFEEKARKNARRSIVAKKDISKGEIISEEMLTFKRPGDGISPVDIKKIVNLKAKTNIKEDDILKYEMLETEE